MRLILPLKWQPLEGKLDVWNTILLLPRTPMGSAATKGHFVVHFHGAREFVPEESREVLSGEGRREGESEWQAGFQSGAFDSASANTFQLQPVDGCVQKGDKRQGRGFVLSNLPQLPSIS